MRINSICCICHITPIQKSQALCSTLPVALKLSHKAASACRFKFYFSWLTSCTILLRRMCFAIQTKNRWICLRDPCQFSRCWKCNWNRPVKVCDLENKILFRVKACMQFLDDRRVKGINLDLCTFFISRSKCSNINCHALICRNSNLIYSPTDNFITLPTAISVQQIKNCWKSRLSEVPRHIKFIIVKEMNLTTA